MFGRTGIDTETDEETSHYLQSTLRERIVEHVFVGDGLRRLWQRGVTDVEVLRSEFDAGAYDYEVRVPPLQATGLMGIHKKTVPEFVSLLSRHSP